MDTNAKGQLGGIECSREARERMAKESGAWGCAGCGKRNAEIMQERDALVKEIEEKEGKRKEDEVPEELRLAYRDELGKAQDDKVDKGKAPAVHGGADTSPATTSAPAVPNPNPMRPASSAPVIRPVRTTAARPLQQVAQTSSDLAWIDTCIYGVVAALLFMVVKKFA